MTKEQASIRAFNETLKFNCDGFVVVKLPQSMLAPFKEIGYFQGEQDEYDYELFTDYDELKKFATGKSAYQYLDDITYLRDGETVVDCYSRSKIIIK